MANKPNKDNMPAQQKDITDLVKRVNKFEDKLEGIDNSFSNMSVDFKEYVNNVIDISAGMGDFLGLQQDSLAGFGRELTSSMRGTLKWSEQMKFDIAAAADENIRDMNAGIVGYEEMSSETGKMLEQRMGGLMEKLRDADQGEAVEIIAQIHAMRDETYDTLKDEEKKRLDFMAATATRGLDTVSTATGMLKGAIKDSLPSLDKFAESMLGGGILGKVAGGLIRRNKARKSAAAQAKSIGEAGGQVDKATAAGLEAQSGASEGGQALAFQLGFESMVAELREQNQNFRELIGIELEQEENLLDTKEEDAETRRIDERQHDEMLASRGGTKTVKSDGGGGGKGFFGSIVGALGGGIMAALQGQWIAKAATFLMSPLKKVVGMVAGGIGKAVSFIMPKKWTSGLSKFFKSTDKQQTSVMKSTKKSGGFLTKLIDTIKKVFKGIIDIIKTIFKTVMEVITSIASGIADVMKQLARGIGYFGKKNVLLGALALVIVAAGILVFAKAMVEFTKVTWKAVGVAAVSILLLVGTLVALGALMMSGIGAVALLLGAAALVIVAGAMWVLGKAMQEFAKAANIAVPAIKVVGKVILDIAKVVLRPFIIIAEAFAKVISSVGDIIMRVIDTVGAVMLGFIKQVSPIIDSITDLIVRPIEALGGVVVDIITAIGGAVEGVIGTTADAFERLGAEGLAGGLGKTALAVGALSVAVVAFATASAGGKVLGSIGNIIGGFLSLFGGGDPPTALEVMAALSTTNPGSMKILPKLIDDISSSLTNFGSVKVSTDDAADAIWVLAEFADELGSDYVINAFRQLSKINMTIFADGLKSLFAVASMSGGTAKVWDNLEFMFDWLKMIPEDEIDKKANAFQRLADSIGDLAGNMVELNRLEGGLSLNQDANIQLRGQASGMQVAMAGSGGGSNTIMSRQNNVVNSTQSFNLPINPRHDDNTLNAIATRRR
jgi:hypothetical protein